MLKPDAASVLRKARKRAHLSQTDVFIRTGVSTATISNIECGRNITPSRRTLIALTEIYGLSLNDVTQDGHRNGASQ